MLDDSKGNPNNEENIDVFLIKCEEEKNSLNLSFKKEYF